MSAVAERAGARAVAAAVARLEARVAEAVPEARVVRDGDTLTITGRGVFDAVRWAGGLLR